MYVNTIKFKSSKVCQFLTSTECFTPENPVYAAVQKTLVEMGYEQECNHVFKGCLGNLHFQYHEQEVYDPLSNAITYEYIKHNRTLLEGATGFITDLEYIFITSVPADKVDMILK